MGPSSRTQQHLFSPGSRPETSRIGDVLRRETVGGTLLLTAAVVALVWANSPWSDSYAAVRDTRIGPAGLHLNLTVGQWAADGLLAVFFFVAGLELKREFVAGDLRDPRHAALPIAAAVAGMIVPALLYLMVNRGADATALRGWAIPIATDIAFALAVLAVIGRHLPPALRTFLLTLAVVDDLLAITVIAVFFTRDLQPLLLLAATLPLVGFGVLVQRRVRSWWLLLPLAVATWTLVHASGVHATVAGVLLAFTVPVLGRRGRSSAEAGAGLAEHFDFRWRPLSAGVAVPVFALFAAGVTVGGLSGLGEAFRSSVTMGIVVGLVVGKAIGVLAGAYLVARLTRATLNEDMTWADVVALSLLAGIGFTVSLLIGELAFGNGTPTQDHATIGVLTGSVLAALLAAIALWQRNRTHRRQRTTPAVRARSDRADQPKAES